MVVQHAYTTYICSHEPPRAAFGDAPGVRVRAVDGLRGCAYIDPGAVTGSLSYVFGPLIDNLQALGYDDHNLVCTAAAVMVMPMTILMVAVVVANSVRA